MFKNNRFWKVVAIVLVIAVAGLVWHDFSRDRTSVRPLATEQSGAGVNKTDQPAPVVPVVKAKAPIVPESETDRKLKALGFGNSAEVHRVIVSK